MSCRSETDLQKLNSCPRGLRRKQSNTSAMQSDTNSISSPVDMARLSCILSSTRTQLYGKQGVKVDLIFLAIKQSLYDKLVFRTRVV